MINQFIPPLTNDKFQFDSPTLSSAQRSYDETNALESRMRQTQDFKSKVFFRENLPSENKKQKIQHPVPSKQPVQKQAQALKLPAFDDLRYSSILPKNQ